MKKNFIFGILAVLLLLSGCGGDKLENKEQVTINKGTISSGVIVGKALEPFTFKDQFDKPISLEATTKKVIFAFTKPTGHIMRVYMGLKKENYLSKRDILFIADISGMPSLIAKMFAIPDMKDSKYSILLIKEKEKALRFRSQKHKNAVMIISLDNKIVKSVKFVTNKEDINKEID